MAESSDKRIAPFGLRLPPALKERVQEAATQSNQSMNALITDVLEREFPQPTINVNELAAFLSGVVSEALDCDGRSDYIDDVNRALAKAKFPWHMRADDGLVTFYPYANAPKPQEDPDQIPF